MAETKSLYLTFDIKTFQLLEKKKNQMGLEKKVKITWEDFVEIKCMK